MKFTFIAAGLALSALTLASTSHAAADKKTLQTIETAVAGEWRKPEDKAPEASASAEPAPAEPAPVGSVPVGSVTEGNVEESNG